MTEPEPPSAHRDELDWRVRQSDAELAVVLADHAHNLTELEAEISALQCARDRASAGPRPGMLRRLVSRLRPRPAEPEPGLVLLDATGHRPFLGASYPAVRPAEWPLVSVIVTSFDYGRFVREAVNSVLAQTFQDLEVIVVEGGSPDPASRVAAADLMGGRVRVLAQGPPRRAGANRNLGISQARGRYVCCLDADDILAPTYVEQAVFLLERHGYDVVSSAMQMFGESEGIVSPIEQPDLASLLLGNNLLICALVRRSLWERAGGYRDVDLGVGYVFEDWAFWLRLAALGARFRNMHLDPLLRYRVHGSSLSHRADKLAMWQQRAMVRQMNADLLDPIGQRIAFSRRQALRRPATPWPPRSPIALGRPPARALLVAVARLDDRCRRLLDMILADLAPRSWRIVLAVLELSDPAAAGAAETFHLARAYPPELHTDFLVHLALSRGIGLSWSIDDALDDLRLREIRRACPALRVASLDGSAAVAQALAELAGSD